MAGTAISRHTAARVSIVFMAAFVVDGALRRSSTMRPHVGGSAELLRLLVSKVLGECEHSRSHVVEGAPAWQAGGGCTTLLRGGKGAHRYITLDLSPQSVAGYALPEGVKLEGASNKATPAATPTVRRWSVPQSNSQDASSRSASRVRLLVPGWRAHQANNHERKRATCSRIVPRYIADWSSRGGSGSGRIHAQEGGVGVF